MVCSVDIKVVKTALTKLVSWTAKSYVTFSFKTYQDINRCYTTIGTSFSI